MTGAPEAGSWASTWTPTQYTRNGAVEIAYDRLLKTIAELGYSGFIGAEYRARAEVEAGLGWLAKLRSGA